MMHNDFFNNETNFGVAPDFSSSDPSFVKFPVFPSSDSDSESDSYLSSNSHSPAPALISSPESHRLSPQPNNNISFTTGSTPQPIFPLIFPQASIEAQQVLLPALPSSYEPPTKKQRTNTQKVPNWSSDNEDDVELEAGFKFLSEAEQKRRRLARKAELARMSRKRKKTKMGDLEAEVLRLTNELEELRRELPRQEVVNTASPKPINELELMDISMKNMIQASKCTSNMPQGSSNSKKAPSDHSSPVVQKHMDEYIHAFHCHQASTAKQLDSIAQAVDPSTMLPLTFLNWLCSQSDKVIQDPSGLWSTLFASEIGVSPEQMKDLLGLRLTIKKQRKVTSDVDRAFKKLNTNLRRQMQQQGENMTRLRSILSSMQMSKLFEWVQINGNVCMNPVNNVLMMNPAFAQQQQQQQPQQSLLPLVGGVSASGSSVLPPVTPGSLALALQIIQAAAQQQVVMQQHPLPPPPSASASHFVHQLGGNILPPPPPVVVAPVSYNNNSIQSSMNLSLSSPAAPSTTLAHNNNNNNVCGSMNFNQGSVSVPTGATLSASAPPQQSPMNMSPPSSSSSCAAPSALALALQRIAMQQQQK